MLNRMLPSLDVDQIIVHTEQNRQTLIDRGESPQSVQVIPHGTYESFAEYDHSNVIEDPRRVLFFRNIVADKGIGTVSDALPLIVDRIPDSR